VVVDSASALPSPERLAYVIAGDLEEDNLGLWEVVWGLNSSHPRASLEEKIGLARRAVSLLGNQADLWRGDPLDPDGGPLTPEDLQALAADDLAWHDPKKASMIVWLKSRA
jgi:hypothetical protein